MFKQLGVSLRLTLASLGLLRQTPAVLAIPAGTLLWTGIWAFGPATFLIWLGQNKPAASREFWTTLFYPTVSQFRQGNIEQAIGLAIFEGYILYAIWLTIVLTGFLYFVTAGMHVATMQIKGQHPSLGEGFRVASRNLGRLMLLALFNATLFAMIRYAVTWGGRVALGPINFIPIVGRLARKAILGTVSGVLTAISYLMLPIIIYERAGPWQAMKSAWNNLKKTWAGLIIGTGLVYGSLWALLNVFAWNIFLFAFDQMEWAMVFSVVSAAVVFAIASAAAAAMRATFYWYATTGTVPPTMNREDLPAIQPWGKVTAPMAAAMVATPSASTAGAPSPAAAQAGPDRADRPTRSLRCPKCRSGFAHPVGLRPTCPTCGHA